MELGHCTKEDFFNQIDIFFENNSLKTFYCPKIKNFYCSFDDYILIIILIFKINLSLSNYPLEHLEKVEKYLKSNPLEMALYYIDTIVDY